MSLAKQANAAAQTKRRRVQIDEVNLDTNTVTGKDQYGLTFQITYGPYYEGNIITFPKQGENWIVEQYRQEWRLKYKAEDLTQFPDFTFASGDKLINVGTLWIKGDANLTNGFLTLQDPTDPQHAATKNYVDTHSGGSGSVSITDGTTTVNPATELDFTSGATITDLGSGVAGVSIIGGVTSVFGRTGAVTAQSGDYTVAQITGAAPLASPTFTGTPAAPTPLTSDNSTTIATTAFVKAQGYITSAPVTSVFTRTGAVTAQSGDYTVSQITGAAPLASPTFTGTPAAPTPATGDNSTTIATTAFVKNQGYVTAITSPVTSVFTRTGTITAQTGDYTVSQITGAAPLASPAFTGTPTAPTPTVGDNSTNIATTAFVTTAVAAVGSNLYKITQTSHGFTVGQILIYNGSSYVLAKADNADDAEVIGIVATVIDANNFILQIAGEVTGLSGLTAGTTYFLSDATAGLLTATVPTTNGSISKPLGIAVSTTALFFFNMRGEIIQQNATNPTHPTRQIFTSGSGTYTTPANCLAILVECLGGGATGGQAQTGSTTGTCVGSGGNGGMFAVKLIITPTATYAYSVGAGGAALVGGTMSHNNGGDTTFGGSIVVAKGGAGGTLDGQTGHTGPFATNPPANQSGSIGDLIIPGGFGGQGKLFSNGGWAEGGAGGRGGGPYGGDGAPAALNGTGASTNGNSTTAGNYGAASSGSIAGPFSGGATNVQAGQGGIIVVTEYYA